MNIVRETNMRYAVVHQMRAADHWETARYFETEHPGRFPDDAAWHKHKAAEHYRAARVYMHVEQRIAAN